MSARRGEELALTSSVQVAWKRTRDLLSNSGVAIVRRYQRDGDGGVSLQTSNGIVLHAGGITLPWFDAWRDAWRARSHQQTHGDATTSTAQPASVHGAPATAHALRLAQCVQRSGDVQVEGRALHVGHVALFALASLSPWDFDRHDLGVTFVNTWIAKHKVTMESIQARQARGDDHVSKHQAMGVKVTSTIKPISQEWKVSVRARLYVPQEDNTTVLAKAGMYLVGEEAPFIGLDADRTWPIGSLHKSKLFANVNFRTCRMPLHDAVRVCCGIQQLFTITKGFDITLRLGVRPFERRNSFFVTPVPNGLYF